MVGPAGGAGCDEKLFVLGTMSRSGLITSIVMPLGWNWFTTVCASSFANGPGAVVLALYWVRWIGSLGAVGSSFSLLAGAHSRSGRATVAVDARNSSTRVTPGMGVNCCLRTS